MAVVMTNMGRIVMVQLFLSTEGVERLAPTTERTLLADTATAFQIRFRFLTLVTSNYTLRGNGLGCPQPLFRD